MPDPKSGSAKPSAAPSAKAAQSAQSAKSKGTKKAKAEPAAPAPAPAPQVNPKVRMAIHILVVVALLGSSITWWMHHAKEAKRREQNQAFHDAEDHLHKDSRFSSIQVFGDSPDSFVISGSVSNAADFELMKAELRSDGMNVDKATIMVDVPKPKPAGGS